MPLNWNRRLPEWRTVSAIYLQQRGGRWSMAVHIARALWSGVVPRQIWRVRILSGCKGCPCFDRELKACAGPYGTGCGCYVPLLALSANPSGRGCWMHTVTDGQGGWPAYHYPTFWARLFSPIAFLLGR